MNENRITNDYEKPEGLLDGIQNPLKMKYPDHIEPLSASVKRTYDKWLEMQEKIDNHKYRYITLVSKDGLRTKIFDLKNSKGLLAGHLKKFGTTEEDFEECMKWKDEIYKLQNKKALLQRAWTKEAYAGKYGDRSVLMFRYDDLIEMFGSYKTQQEVQYVLNGWGYAVNQDKLRKFQMDNREAINNKKAEYLTKKNDFRYATDTGRLEVLSTLANENMDKYDKTKSLVYSREVRAILEQIRKEVKGEEIRLTIDGRIDINATVAANKTMNEVFSKLPINMVVVALTAAKSGVNPTSMMNKLCSSYYHKWNGFARLDDKSKIELPGKFIKTYDWNAIKMMHLENDQPEIEEAEYEEQEVVSEDVVERVEFVQKKSTLFEMLNDYKKQLSKD